MAQGHDKPQILAYFVKKYGEKILSAPTARGFNLLAWGMPFALLLLAGGVLALVMVRWSHRGQGSPPAPPQAGGPTAYRDVLEHELRTFDQ